MRAPAILAISAMLAIMASPSLCAALPISAQTTSAAHPSPKALPAHRAAHARKRLIKTSASKSAPAPQPAPAIPPAPKLPNWPVNDPPARATVVWDSHGLRIQAANSSLQQILDEVSTETGAKVEGFGKDERIFGTYGPGDPRDVLAQLLDGTAYNLLMIGGQSASAPLQVVLTARTAGAPEPPVTHTEPADDYDNAPVADEQPQPVQPPVSLPMQPHGFGIGQPPRTPQQIMQEMQLRQQQMEQQQQQQSIPQY